MSVSVFAALTGSLTGSLAHNLEITDFAALAILFISFGTVGLYMSLLSVAIAGNIFVARRAVTSSVSSAAASTATGELSRSAI